jgi:uncharacterized protein
MPVEARDIFTLILEPVKGCNLQCIYCYSDISSAAVMSRQTLRIVLEKTARYAERQGFKEIHLLWHGGEPLLAGLGFFQDATQMLEALFSGLKFRQYLQTNGLLLDHDFCAFFRDHAFQIGLSLDGPPDLHDELRSGPGHRGTHAAVLEKLGLLEEERIPAGINAVVSRRSLGQEKRIYRYFQSLNYSFRTNPMVPGRNAEACEPYLLQPGEYGIFLGRLFDAWAGAALRRVRVSPLDLYLEAIISGEPSECQQQATCAGTHLGVKPSGETVLCSRFESQFLGTIHDQEIEELVASSFCQDIQGRAEILSSCHSCPYWSICHGGCPLNALVFCHDHLVKDPFCPDYQLIFAKIRRELASLEQES